MIRLLSSTNENTLISAMATLYYLMDYPQGLTGLPVILASLLVLSKASVQTALTTYAACENPKIANMASCILSRLSLVSNKHSLCLSLSLFVSFLSQSDRPPNRFVAWIFGGLPAARFFGPILLPCFRWYPFPPLFIASCYPSRTTHAHTFRTSPFVRGRSMWWPPPRLRPPGTLPLRPPPPLPPLPLGPRWATWPSRGRGLWRFLGERRKRRVRVVESVKGVT